MNFNKITLVIATKNPNETYLKQALEYHYLFDEVVVHINSPIDFDLIPSKCIKIIDYNPMPAYQAYNEAIKLASSEWIICSCDDDYFDREHLEWIIDTIKDPILYYSEEYDILYSQCYLVDKKGKHTLWGNNSDYLTFEMLKEKNRVPFASFFKKKVWEEIGGLPPTKFNDWCYWLCAMKKRFKFKYIGILYWFQRQNHKKTLSDKERDSQDFEKTRQEILDYVERLK